jgi:hypothetical protein
LAAPSWARVTKKVWAGVTKEAVIAAMTADATDSKTRCLDQNDFSGAGDGAARGRPDGTFLCLPADFFDFRPISSSLMIQDQAL